MSVLRCIATRLRFPQPFHFSRSAPYPRRWSAGALVLVPALAFALASCSDDDDDDSDTGSDRTTVAVTQGDGTIDLDRDASSTRDVEFDISNKGELTHQFVVIRTDITEDKLPIAGDGKSVDESGDGVDVVDEKESIGPGTDATLSVSDLEPGKYVLICNVPGHYQLGMHASFVVE